jgi:hypothetical protein
MVPRGRERERERERKRERERNVKKDRKIIQGPVL